MEGVDFSSSNPVLMNVKEFAKEQMSTAAVPKSYICRDQEPDLGLSDCGINTLAAVIPTIDMEKLVFGEPTECYLELQKLHSSCKDWGLFQVFFNIFQTLPYICLKKIKIAFGLE